MSSCTGTLRMNWVEDELPITPSCPPYEPPTGQPCIGIAVVKEGSVLHVSVNHRYMGQLNSGIFNVPVRIGRQCFQITKKSLIQHLGNHLEKVEYDSNKSYEDYIRPLVASGYINCLNDRLYAHLADETKLKLIIQYRAAVKAHDFLLATRCLEQGMPVTTHVVWKNRAYGEDVALSVDKLPWNFPTFTIYKYPTATVNVTEESPSTLMKRVEVAKLSHQSKERYDRLLNLLHDEYGCNDYSKTFTLAPISPYAKGEL